jgi:hypothetical protein
VRFFTAAFDRRTAQMSQQSAPRSAHLRRRLVYTFGSSCLVVLVFAGIFAKNGWFPSTDPLSGKRTGWFGSVPPAAAGGGLPLTSYLPPPPNPTPQLSKEYIYAGSRLLAVEDANANAAPPADLAIWRPSTGVWWILRSEGQYSAITWGGGADQPVPGDFDGDGKTDLSIFRPSSNEWWIYRSSDNGTYAVTFGSTNEGDKTAPADYDGDGKTDVAVYRPSNGAWYILQSSNSTVIYPQFGNSSDIPAAADYDGDGRADLGVWRSTNNTMYSLNSSNSALAYFSFSSTSSEALSADYDGDGRADYAIRNGSNWIIRKSSTATTETVSWYNSGDSAVQNDYDGDGKCDIAVWRPADSYSGAGDAGTWFIRQSGLNNSLRQQQWGTTGDIPVPAYYRR